MSIRLCCVIVVPKADDTKFIFRPEVHHGSAANICASKMSYATPPSATKDVGRVFDEGMRHSTLYWPNGDLVVSAQDSAGKTQLFRVHIATLAQHFPIFSAMLALPSGATSEAYDGAPLVHFPDVLTWQKSLMCSTTLGRSNSLDLFIGNWRLKNTGFPAFRYSSVTIRTSLSTRTG